jgi:ABC-type transport system substrate-binding protein
MLLFFPWEKAPEGIVIGSSNLPDSLNPILEQNTQAINANELVFDGLVNFEVDAASRTIGSEFAIAENITQDPVTKKIYTATLRQMNWHDGTGVTAKDVVFSYKAYVEPVNKSPKREYLLSFIEDVKAIDDKTPIMEKNLPSIFAPERMNDYLLFNQSAQAPLSWPPGRLGNG